MIVDLSVEVNKGTSVYPGDPPVSIKPTGILERDGFNDHVLTLGTHVGTHIDAPVHMIKDAKTLGQYEITKFIGRGVLIDVRGGYDLAAIKQMDIKAGDVVLLWTGMMEHYSDPKVYFENYEDIPLEVASFFAEQAINMLGMDMCSPDKPPFDVHKVLLGSDVLIIENVANLSQLEGKKFTVTALPVKLNIDAAPARVIAEIK